MFARRSLRVSSLILLICILLLSTGFLCSAENPVPDSLRDLASLKQDSNPARLEALKKILEEQGIRYELQTFTSPASPHGRTQGTNLVIAFGKGSREITVGAHYDALEMKPSWISEGMLDNGASAIALVRVAEALKRRKLRHRVRIVLFDMEEIGLFGSKAYVDAHKANIVAAINLDVVGFGDALIYGPVEAGETDRIQKALLMSCADQLTTCMGFERFPGSDHRSFQNANIPVISISFCPRLMAHQAWLLMNARENSGLQVGFLPEIFRILHTPADNISKIEPATLDRGVQTVLNTILKLDASLK